MKRKEVLTSILENYQPCEKLQGKDRNNEFYKSLIIKECLGDINRQLVIIKESVRYYRSQGYLYRAYKEDWQYLRDFYQFGRPSEDQIKRYVRSNHLQHYTTM